MFVEIQITFQCMCLRKIIKKKLVSFVYEYIQYNLNRIRWYIFPLSLSLSFYDLLFFNCKFMYPFFVIYKMLLHSACSASRKTKKNFRNFSRLCERRILKRKCLIYSRKDTTFLIVNRVSSLIRWHPLYLPLFTHIYISIFNLIYI